MSKSANPKNRMKAPVENSTEVLKKRISDLEAKLAETEKERAKNESLLKRFHLATESTDEGLALYDAVGNLVFCNSAYAALYPSRSKVLEAGIHRDEMIKRAAKSGLFVEANENPTKYVATRKKELKSKKRMFFRHAMVDGRILEFGDFKSADGGMLSLRRDVTARVHHERALETAHQQSAQLLESFTTHSPIALYLKDKNGRFTFASKAFETGFNLKPGAAIGKTSAQLFTDPHAKAARKNDTTILKSGKTTVSSATTQNKDGARIYFEVTKFPVRDASGAITGIGGVHLDRTAEINAQMELEKSHAKLKDYAESASDWFWEQDADLRMIEITGKNIPEPLRDPAVYLGKTRWEIAGADPDSDPRWGKHRDTLLARLPFRDFRFSTRPKNGSVQHLSVSGRPTFDKDGAFSGYRGSAADITEQVTAIDTAEKAHQLLDEALEHIPASVIMFDADDKLVLSNSRSKEIIPWNRHLLKPGVKYEALVRNTIKQRQHTQGMDDASYLKFRLQQHANPGSPSEIQRKDGRWMLV
ncbi:MAG: PAS-domain containing protein, partial [Proteobacteria bacterium]|nr:PAS-domain containing protein [Pseudomonadota bacterium]